MGQDSESDLGDHRPDVYWDDEVSRYVYRASSLGNCERALVMHRAGIGGGDAPEFMQAAYAAGNRLEARLIRELCQREGWSEVTGETLHQYGRISHNGQVEAAFKVGGGAMVRCHPDGIVVKYKSEPMQLADIPLGERRVVEVKALGESFYRKMKDGIGNVPFYDWQWAVEMVSTGLKGAYVMGLKCPECKASSTTECGLCEDGLLDITIKYYDEPTHTKAEIVKRVLHLERVGRAFDAGEQVSCDWKMFPCPFYATHDTTEGVWSKDVTALSDTAVVRLNDLVREYREHDAIATEHLVITNRAKEEIKALLSGEGLTSYRDDLVTYSERTNPGQLDKTLLEKAGLDPDKYRKPSTTVRTLKIAPLSTDKGSV